MPSQRRAAIDVAVRVCMREAAAASVPLSSRRGLVSCDASNGEEGGRCDVFSREGVYSLDGKRLICPLIPCAVPLGVLEVKAVVRGVTRLWVSACP